MTWTPTPGLPVSTTHVATGRRFPARFGMSTSACVLGVLGVLGTSGNARKQLTLPPVHRPIIQIPSCGWVIRLLHTSWHHGGGAIVLVSFTTSFVPLFVPSFVPSFLPSFLPCPTARASPRCLLRETKRTLVVPSVNTLFPHTNKR